MRAVKETVKQYYRTFIQPTLTSNGTMGGDSFACTGSANVSNAYLCFDGSTSSWDTYSSSAPQWVTCYNPNPLNVTKIVIKQYTEPNYYYITSAIFQGSNDNSTWTNLATIGNCYNQSTITVAVNNSNYYQYYRLYVASANYFSGYPRVMIGEISMTATEHIEAGFDVNVYKLPVDTTTNTYKAIKY